MPPPLLLVVDGNSVLHRAHHAGAGSPDPARDREDRPVWGLRGLVTAIAAAAARCLPDALLVGFDCPEHSVRRAAFPAYKAHRPDKPAALRAQLDDAPALLDAAGVAVATVRGFEADDVLASAAALARRSGWLCLLMTSDRDAFALIDATTSVLRVVNGGIDDSPVLTPAGLLAAYGVTPEQYRDFAALRGDPSDNLPGVPGVGSKTAARLISAFHGVEAVYRAIDSGRAGEVAALAGENATATLAAPAQRAALARARELMSLYEDLPLPAPDRLRLPLDAARLSAALAARDIRLGPSLWALIGGSRPPWTPPGFDRAPGYLPGAHPPPWALSRWAAPPDPGRATATATAGAPGRPPATRVRRRPSRPRDVPAGQLLLF